MSPTPEYWFPAKRYGWGWGLPRCWQGWAVMLVWVLTLVAAVERVGSDPGDVSLLVLGWTAMLVAVCWWKGEPPNGGFRSPD
jgi:hypothetical protein